MKKSNLPVSDLGLRTHATIFAAVCAVVAMQACTNDIDGEDVDDKSPTATPAPPPSAAESLLYMEYQAWRDRRDGRAAINGRSDTLAEYAAKCDLATGIHVPPFNCDNGIEVPGQGNTPRGQMCDAPNVLNHVCDPGSKFQVLVQTEDAAAVAHCRKDGLPISGSSYNDIAVIQYNKSNGAVCFYQALGYGDGPLSNHVAAPSAPFAGDSVLGWKSPEATEAIHCTGCHDSGGFIRSPYLAQLTTLPNALPSVAAGFDNGTTPLKYVGLDFVTNRSWSVTAPDPSCPPGESCLPCTTCHRLGVSNIRAFSMINGTAGHFANVATAAAQLSKTPHSPSSPIWMRPGQIIYSIEAQLSALQFQSCANGFWIGQSDGFTSGTPTPGCTFTPLGQTWTGLSPAQVASLL